MLTNYIVISNCTSRKRRAVPLLRFAPDTGRSLEECARTWKDSIAFWPHQTRAGDLYVGRAVSEARLVAQSIDASLMFASAGLGLVGSDQVVPGYELAVNSPELLNLLRKSAATAPAWWALMNGGSALHPLLARDPKTLVMLALPSEYLGLIEGDLRRLPPDQADRVWVFTSTAGQRRLAQTVPSLSPVPYDDRLESIAGFSGTRSDFPQRALKHFVLELRGHLHTAEQAGDLVTRSMAANSLRTVPTRTKLSDDHILELLRENWVPYSGNSSRLLRHLRDTLLVACEQKRFAGLRRQVQAEMASDAAIEHSGVLNVV